MPGWIGTAASYYYHQRYCNDHRRDSCQKDIFFFDTNNRLFLPFWSKLFFRGACWQHFKQELSFFFSWFTCCVFCRAMMLCHQHLSLKFSDNQSTILEWPYYDKENHYTELCRLHEKLCLLKTIQSFLSSKSTLWFHSFSLQMSSSWRTYSSG